jgi:hypothetical protein
MAPSSDERAIHRENLSRLVDAVQRRVLSVESQRIFVLMGSASPSSSAPTQRLPTCA